MPAKYLQVLGEDRRPELHRQTGCVTGIFQAFDRRYPLAAHHSHKRLLPPAHALSSSPSVGEERTRYSSQIVLDKNLSKSWIDNQRAPLTVELSQGSCSSSSCSSLSSLDGNRSTQQDLSSTDRMLFPEKPFKCSPKLKSSSDSDNGVESYLDDALAKLSAQSSYPTHGIRNLVKDSIYRDSRDSSARTFTKEAEKDHLFSCGDQPRSLDEPPSSATQEKNKGTVDINESLRVLAKFREPSWNPSESGQQPRLSYDAPRFSCEGRESASKFREVPRLSLDIKESPLRNREIDLRSKPSMIAEDGRSSINRELNPALETQQEQNACKRLPSVVAKLMGLEALPEHKDNTVIPSQVSKSVTERSEEPMLRPLNFSSHNEPTPRQQRNLDATIRNVPNSKFPVETAPWKQQEKIVLPRKLPKGSKGVHGKEQPAASVYSEIEKRLKDLDFQQSNKDLRALKQILDSMQAKGLLQNKKREEPSMLKIHDGENDNREATDVNQRPNGTSNTQQAPEGALSFSMEEESTTERCFKSPIVIMKPAKSADLLSNVAEDSTVDPLGGLSELPQLRTVNSADKKKSSKAIKAAVEQHMEPSSRVPAPQPVASFDKRANGRNEDISRKQKSTSQQMTESSARRQQMQRDNNGSLLKHKNSTSPRVVQKKHDLERRARPPIPSSDSNKNQRQSVERSHLDSVSPRSKFRRKPAQAQQVEDGHQNGVSSRTRSLNQQGNDMSVRSDGSISVASELDVEVTSADRSADVNVSSSRQGTQTTPSGRNPQKVKTSYDANKDLPSMDPAATISERPSPVSVLDSSFDQEDYFRTNKVSNSSNVDDERHPSPSDQSSKPSDNRPAQFVTQAKNSKLANIASLLEKLEKLNVNKDEEEAPPVDHIAFLCETPSPDHRYVSEILLASGLLMKDLGSSQMQLHASSGCPINPDLFHVLEQRKSGWASKQAGANDPKRAHRRLVFDAVNELLLERFDGESGVHSSAVAGARGRPAISSGQQLVRMVCSGIERLSKERSRMRQEDGGGGVIPDGDILQRLEGWSPCFGRRELPAMVLEIERSIFKELVDEVVRGESADGRPAKAAGRRRRRLFA
ncbi:protein LONGIFOLIA 2 [Oryza brachyantha]|uniref:protein LONGIFOLIA 2 n=1 Tax=Oryza brachyantha TaxID=4533 RepID=UPI001ADBC7AE|nr:protein LONGIFOLIA 2 [Oryza brachyantha]